MTKKLVLGNHLVPAILAHLGAMATLPEDGLLAGQALCSAILDLYCGGGGVYNDIDVFVPASAEKLAELTSDERRREDALSLGIPVAQLDGYQQMSLDSDDGVHMAGSEMEGLLNIIWCDVEDDELTPGRLVYSFDINAIEVALDIKHQELTWSRGFEEFLGSRQLEITSLATPERTLLRYLKKRHEFAPFGQDSLVLDMVATWLLSDSTPTLRPALTTKALGLARQFESQLAGRFELKDDGLLYVAADWTPPEHMQTALEEQVSDYVSAGGVIRMVPTMWYRQSRVTAAAPDEFAEGLAEHVVSKNGYDGLVNVMHLAASMLRGDYVRGQRSNTHRDTVLRVLESHEGLNSALLGLTLEEQYRCVLDLAKRAKSTAGQLVYGLVETTATPVDMWNAHHREQFFRQMERETAGSTACTPYFLPYQRDGWVVRELCSRSALRAEGMTMNHCVGGYYPAVKSGRSRILSIRHASNGKWASTVEMTGEFKDGGAVRIAQHYTYKNNTPAKQTKELLDEFLAHQRAELGFTMKKEDKTRSIFDAFAEVPY